MSKLNLVRVSDLKTEKQRTDSKVSRQYYTIYVVDAANPFTGTAQRVMWQTHSQDGKSAFWKGLDHSQAQAFIGSQLEGEIVRLQVKPYDINGRTANNYTCLVLKGEDAASIARQNGHEVVTSIPVTKTVKESL